MWLRDHITNESLSGSHFTSKIRSLRPVFIRVSRITVIDDHQLKELIIFMKFSLSASQETCKEKHGECAHWCKVVKG